MKYLENCSKCNNTGWILPSNGKIPCNITPIYGEEIFLPEKEQMIKCNCGH